MDASLATIGPDGPPLAHFIEFISDATFGVADDGRIAICNAQAATLFGGTREELLGRQIDELVGASVAGRHARRRAAYLAAPRTRRMGEGGPLTARRLDGEEFPVEVSLSRFEGSGGGAGLVFAAVRDISGRLATDERAQSMQTELERARKMESVGQLAGGIAHDFNNLLAVIMNFTDLALRSVPSETEIAHDLAEIRHAAERGRALTRKLLIVGRRDVRRPTRLDLAALLTGLRPLLLSATGSNIELDYRLGATRTILADEAQVEQIVLNLVVNARDAMPDGGRLRIETANADVEGDSRVPAGRYVRLEVIDSGTGMSPEVLRSSLEPFFTTKPPGDGTGLGLATVHGIVRDTGGVLYIESEVGVGTTVEIHLPAPLPGTPIDLKRTTAPHLDATVGPTLSGARVLVVEDEAPLRESTARALELGGYVVEAAAGGAEARESFAGAPFDAYVVDVVMPGESGPEFVRWLRAQAPDAPVLYVSGDWHGHLDPARLSANETLLPKPFSAESLLAQVARLLNRT